MKPFLTLFLALAAFVFTDVTAEGAQVIYRSIGHQVIYGNSKITRLTVRGFLVLDPITYRGTAVAGFTLNGRKLFSVVPLQNYRVDTIAGPRGSFTIIAKAESPGTQFEGVLLEAVYLRGKDQALAIGPQESATIPRAFVSSAHAISQDAQTAIKVSAEATGSYVMDMKATYQSNQQEDFDGAVARLKRDFLSRNFSEISLTPAK